MSSDSRVTFLLVIQLPIFCFRDDPEDNVLMHACGLQIVLNLRTDNLVVNTKLTT